MFFQEYSYFLFDGKRSAAATAFLAEPDVVHTVSMILTIIDPGSWLPPGFEPMPFFSAVVTPCAYSYHATGSCLQCRTLFVKRYPPINCILKVASVQFSAWPGNMLCSVLALSKCRENFSSFFASTLTAYTTCPSVHLHLSFAVQQIHSLRELPSIVVCRTRLIS